MALCYLFIYFFLFVARENCAYASWLNTITAVARRRFGIEVNTFKTSGYPVFVINVILSIIAVCAGISEVRVGRTMTMQLWISQKLSEDCFCFLIRGGALDFNSENFAKIKHCFQIRIMELTALSYSLSQSLHLVLFFYFTSYILCVAKMNWFYNDLRLGASLYAGLHRKSSLWVRYYKKKNK